MNKIDHRGKALDPGKHARRLMKEKKYSEAEKKYQEALELDPYDIFPLVGLGDLKRKQKRFDQAVSLYKKALELNETNKYALMGLGDAYRGLHNIVCAKDFVYRLRLAR